MRAVSSLLIILMALLPSTASPQNTNVQASIDLIIQYYNRSCHAEQSDVPRIDEDPIEPTDMLATLDPVNIYEIQIDGAGSRATVLYPSFHCKNFGYVSCGTGGCGFFVIVDDQIFFRSGGSEPHSAIIQNAYGTDAVIVYGIHGGGCDDAQGRGGAGVAPCYGAAAWDEDAKTFFSRDGELHENGNPKLIIIDTVARHMAGKDENNAKEMGELVQTADKLKHDYQCAVMLVHHTGHNNQDRARGSTAFKGALDTEILVKPLGDNDIIVSCEKQKDGPQFDTMQFLKVSVDPSIALQQVIRSVPKTKLSGSQRLAMDTFYEATKGNVASAGLALDEWRPLFNERHTGDNIKSKDTAFRRAREALVDKGLLECSDDIYRLGDKAT